MKIYVIELEMIGQSGEVHLEYYVIGVFLGDLKENFID